MKIQSEKINIISLNDIKPYEKNPHVHSSEQIERLAKIIEYQGFRVPLVVCEESKTIACGHGRYLAAKRLGLEKIPVIFQKFDSHEQFYAFVVSDNAIGKDEWAALDFSQINKDLKELGGELDLEFLGLKNFYVNMDEPIADDTNSDSSELKTEFQHECPSCGFGFD